MVVDVVEKNTGPRGKDRPSSFASTSVPAVKRCLTASMFPSLAASRIEMSGALGGVVGFVASATGSAGFVSGAGADCCDSPHPTSTTAAIVVSRRCFICKLRSSGGAGWLSLLIDTRKTRWESHWDTRRRRMTCICSTPSIAGWGDRFGFIKRFNMITPRQQHRCDCN